MKKFYMLFIALVPMLVWGQITWNFGTGTTPGPSPSSGAPVTNITTISDLSQGNNNGTTTLLTTTSVSSGYTGATGSYNAGAAARTGALVTAAAGSAYFEFTLTPAAGFSVFITEIDFGTRSTSTGPQAYSIRTNLDNYAADITGGTIAANSTWTLKTNTLSFTGSAGTAVTFRIYGYNGTGSPAAGTANWRIDDLAVSATATSSGGGNTPAIVVAASGLTPFATTTGTASAAQNITVGGIHLTHDIVITPPSLYEVSVDGGANYSTTALTLTQTAGTVANTPVSIRISASAPTGAANGNLAITSTDAADQSVALTGTVNSGITVAPPQAFSSTAVSASEIDLAATGNGTDNIVVATNSSAAFGTPSGTLTAGNTIAGGGTVLYSGSASGFTFQHTGLNASTKYYYQVWSVDGAANYSTALTANATTFSAPAANIVINQVYGGGGNSGAIFKNDFIELYNNENTPVNLSGWSLQYGGPTGTGNFTVHALSGTIQPHNFFLVQEAAGANGTVNLPTPDATGSLSLGAAGGKIILSNSTTAFNGANPAGAGIIDKVGYGSANGFETSPAAGPASGDNLSSVQRITDGVDNNNNLTDFMLAAANPRNGTYKTTAPVVLSLTPPNGAINVPSTVSLSLIFDKKIVKGTGTITIVENGVAGTPIDVNDAAVVISNNSNVSIAATLNPGKSYYILISAGAFKDVYNNNFAGITANTGWAFTTYDIGVATTLPASFDFQNCTGSGLLPNGFTQYNTSGAQVWDCTSFGRDPGAPTGTTAYPNAIQINGYANGIDNQNRDWLISPKFDLSGTDFPLLSFWSRTAFAGDPLELKISTDYTGSGDPSLATWTDLNGKFPGTGSDTWTNSKDINLVNYKQNGVYIAFVYTSTTDDGSRWTIDDISLINSPAPPAPSLTLGSTNIEFGYTAAGSNSTKDLTLTANDLTGDVTLTTTGNFQVSTDNITFGNTATIAKADANNVPQTIHVRFAPGTANSQFNETLSVAISDSTGIVTLKGNSIDPASTLNVVNWNMAWFATPDPTPGFGPANKSVQQDNAAKVIKSIGADLFVLQEVVNEHALDSIVQTMPGYAYKINNYGSYSNPALTKPTDLKFIQKLAFVYKISKFSNIHTDSLLTLGIALAADTATSYYNAFASGRFPYMLSADVTLSDNNGGFITHTMRFINIHGKANTGQGQDLITAYNRRAKGAFGLDSLIQNDFKDDNVIILGDYNDDLNQTITAGITPPVTSYSSFTVDHASSYIFPTKPLSPAGQHSDVNFTGSVIDNVIATATSGKYYLPGSATVLSDVANVVTKYGTSTSDHYPVFTQFSFSTAAALPVTLLSFNAVKQNTSVKVLWSTSQEINSQLFDVERSADGNSFTKIGTVTAQGNSSIKVDYGFSDNQPINGTNYYRLKQIDKDGKFVYSKVVKINFTKLPGVRISPNPASSYIYLSLENINSTVNLQLIDGNGKLVKQQLISQGTVNKTISLNGVAHGLYTIKLVSQEQVVTQKLVVQ